jgi:hypothetical protein
MQKHYTYLHKIHLDYITLKTIYETYYCSIDFCWWLIVQARIFTLYVTIVVYFIYV